jgi:hypothetical protein
MKKVGRKANPLSHRYIAKRPDGNQRLPASTSARTTDGFFLPSAGQF